MELKDEAKLGMILGGMYLLGVVVGGIAMKNTINRHSSANDYLEGYKDALNTIGKICRPDPKDI